MFGGGGAHPPAPPRKSAPDCSKKLTIALGGGLAGSKPKSGGGFCPLMYLVRKTFFPFKSVARTW